MSTTYNTNFVDNIQLPDNNAYPIRAGAIPYGEVDSTSTSTAYTATVDGIYSLQDGVCMLLKNGQVTSSSNFTININGLGAKPVYNNMETGNEITPTAPTRETSIFNINYTMFFIYSSTIVSGGAWICYRGYDSNTNTVGHQLRTSSGNLTASERGYRYRLWLTSADGTKWVPINTSSATNSTTQRTLNTTPINPFGAIIYNGFNGTTNANARPDSSNLWQQFPITIGFSYVLSLTAYRPVYLQCIPQTNGSAVMEVLTQTLPTTEDGKIYIFLGLAYSTTSMELNMNHPVYYYADGALRLWTNAQSGSSVTVDTAMSSTSTNPVQNKVINTALENKVDKDVASGNHSGTIANSGSSVSLSYENSTAGQTNEIVVRQTRAEMNVYNNTSSAEASVTVSNAGSVILYANNGSDDATYSFNASSATIPDANLTGTPTAPTAAVETNTTQVATTAFVQTATSGKQDTLVSGTNIKTINGNSILGSGNLSISTGSNYTAGDGINITNNEISVASNLTVSGHTAYISYVAGSGINSASGVSF